MAITMNSFVPEERGAGGAGGGPGGPGGGAGNSSGGPSTGHAATVAHGMNTDYNHATDSAMTAMHESMPATHPVSGTALPKGTGAGTGTIRKGGRGGK